MGLCQHSLIEVASKQTDMMGYVGLPEKQTFDDAVTIHTEQLPEHEQADGIATVS